MRTLEAIQNGSASISSSAMRALASISLYAAEVDSEPWQFALEMETLKHLGASPHELRQLVARGLLEHRLEVTTPDSEQRAFRRLANLSLPSGACFVPTLKGTAWLQLQLALSSGRSSVHSHPAPAATSLKPIPRWDPHHRILTLADNEVKSFRVPARNQEAILEAFEIAGWPPCIPDPLRSQQGEHPGQRLVYAIKALNRSQQLPSIRFFGDGTGRRVCWKSMAAFGAMPTRIVPVSGLDRTGR